MAKSYMNVAPQETASNNCHNSIDNHVIMIDSRTYQLQRQYTVPALSGFIGVAKQLLWCNW